MKRPDDNDRTVSSLNRLTDEELNIGKDLEDDIPGLDDSQTFDFSDEDIKRIRKRNLEEGEKAERQGAASRINRIDAQGRRRAARSAGQEMPEKPVARPKKPKMPAKGGADGGNTVMWSLANKKETNREIRHVLYVMLILLFGMIGWFVYFNTRDSRDVVNDSRNQRLALLAESVSRGTIYASDGEVLAEEIRNEDGSYSRYYPYGRVFAHVIGTSEVNKSGVELTADYDLVTSSVQPLDKIYNDLNGEKNPGNNVVTTLNTKLQQAAYDALGDRDGAVIAMEPSTGRILAMVSKPDYDPNELPDIYQDVLEDEDSKILLNQATQGLFTPGSIFKIVTTLAYLRSGNDPDSFYYECDGSIALDTENDTSELNCYGGEVHGSLDLEDAFAESCNSAYAYMGQQISAKAFSDTAKEMLFNVKLPSDFTTAVSSFKLDSSDSQWQAGATAIGQGNTVLSPMHALMIVSAAANDGVLMKPYVISGVHNAENETVSHNEPSEAARLMSESEADRLQEMMRAVVTEGTGYYLSDRSYEAAGKTGTAEVAGRGNNAWFVGYAPADDPKIAVAVLVEDAGTASSEAVPVAAELFDAYLSE